VDLTRLLEILEEWRGLLTRHVAAGRQILRKLIPNRLTFTLHATVEGGRWYEWEGVGRLAPMLVGVVPVMTDGQRWWPQRDTFELA